jgi:hypothetical protein
MRLFASCAIITREGWGVFGDEFSVIDESFDDNCVIVRAVPSG